MATITYGWRTAVASFRVNVDPAGLPVNPAIVGLSDGSFVAGWTNTATTSTVQAIGSNGVPGFTSEGVSMADPALTQLVDGRLAISVDFFGDDTGGDVFVKVGAAGGPFNLVAVNTHTTNDGASDIAALPDGGYVVAWTRNFGGGDKDVNATVLNADGGIRAGGPVDGAGIPVSSRSILISSNQSSVAAYSGGFIVAWEESPVGGGNFSVHYRRYTAAGVAIDTAPVLLDASGVENENIQVIGLADGGFAFAYEDNNWNTGTTDITFWIFNADGTSRGFARANTTFTGAQIDPSLTLLDNGFIVVGWQDAPTNEIRYQAFTPSVAPVGVEFTAATSATQADIAGLGNGLVANVHASLILDEDGRSMRSTIDQFVRTTTGDATDEVLYGDSLPDIMLGNGGEDSLVGMAGDDDLSGGVGRDFLFGADFAADGSFKPGSGKDTLDGGDDNDGLWGGDGVDLLRGRAGNDGMAGGAGDDALFGGEGGDFLFGGDFSVVNGSRLPGSGKDFLNGDGGNDALYGFDGDDDIRGGLGNDYVEGGEGADVIDGGADSDTLQGQAGTDTLSGRSGFDYLYGGGGADIFVFRVGDSYDTVWDFSVSEEDVLRLDPGFGVADLAAFKARAKTFVFEGKNYTQFTSTDGADQITLAGVRPDQLTAANFEILVPL